MQGKRKRNARSASTAHLMLHGAFFCVGLLFGFLCDRSVSDQARVQLSSYLHSYVTFTSAESAEGAFLAVFLGYLRYPAMMFAAGFLGGGAFMLPALFVVQGFSLSFAVLCFIGSMGRQGLLASLCLLGVRCLFVLPCSLYLAGAVLQKNEQRRPYLAKDYLVFCVCLGVLLLGALLDFILVPKLLRGIII